MQVVCHVMSTSARLFGFYRWANIAQQLGANPIGQGGAAAAAAAAANGMQHTNDIQSYRVNAGVRVAS
jgi:hypothetical protein